MFTSVLKLTIATLIPVVAAVIFAKNEKEENKKKNNSFLGQLKYGIIFGIIAIIGTEWGIPMNGAMVNCRDAAPVIAGLFFGGPAGIIAGIIGGVERWFAVYWGVGSYTRVACSISTIFAGCISALLRKYMFDGKRPNWFLALFSGVSIEVFHLCMVFITNIDNAEKAIKVVEVCTVPMITANGIAVMLTSIVLYIMSSKKQDIHKKAKVKSIFETIQNWLLGVIFFAFFIVSSFMIVLESNLATTQIEEQISLAMNEVKQDVEDTSNEYQIDLTKIIANEINTTDYNLEQLTEKYNISEICIINENGIITECSDKEYIGFNMNSGEQSAEFLCLLNGESEYAQAYGAIAADETIFMKYAGVATNNGFIQTGYNAEQFQNSLNSKIKTSLKNRHIGKNGFFLVFDENNSFISSSANYSAEDAFEISEIDLSSLKSDKIEKIIINNKSYFISIMNQRDTK